MSDRREKQLEIVLKLNKLTKEGKISWAGHSLQSMGTLYSARFKNRRFYLTDSPLSWPDIMVESFEPVPSLGFKFFLCIQEDDNESKIWIPPMPAVDDLASSVHHQLTQGDTQDLDEVLRDLEDAENLL